MELMSIMTIRGGNIDGTLAIWHRKGCQEPKKRCMVFLCRSHALIKDIAAVVIVLI